MHFVGFAFEPVEEAFNAVPLFWGAFFLVLVVGVAFYDELEFFFREVFPGDVGAYF